MKIKKKRKATTNGLRLAEADEPVQVPPVEQQFDAILVEAHANVLAGATEATRDPAPEPIPASPGTVRMISDAEATAVLAANRAILHAQEDARATVVKLNERIAAEKANLATLVERCATTHGISLDPANGRWSFDVSSGSFTRLQDEATS